ncbi:deoxynucleotidyltransferase terminal-interacting protein 2 isoform X1 [Pogona vitticeps]
MVATRRSTRRSESEAGSNDPPEQTSMEGSASVRITRSRSKVNSHANDIPESPGKMKASETEWDVEEPSEEQSTLNKTKAAYSKALVAEVQADGDVSEAESNCSSVSGLQTPSFIRITRRRQIVVPCQPEFPARNRQSKKAPSTEGSTCQEDDDISEAESCSSTVSGRRTPNVARRTRNRQIKTNMSLVLEAQTEEVSDAESWCSGISTEPSATVKRVTRSMRLRLPGETPSKSERKSEVVVENAKLPEHAVTSETIVISDSEQPTKDEFDTEHTFSLSDQINKSPHKRTCHYGTVVSSDIKQSSPKKTVRENTQMSPEKEVPKGINYESVSKAGRDNDRKESVSKQMSSSTDKVVGSPDEECDQTIDKSITLIENQSPIKSQSISPCNHKNLDQSNISPGPATPSKAKSHARTEPLGSSKDTQKHLLHVEIDKPSNSGDPKSNIILSLSTESSDDDCRASVVSIDSDASPEEPVAESSSHAGKTSGAGKCFTVSLLTSDENDESEGSDLEEMDKTPVSASKQGTLAMDKSHNEELFVIDKTAGLDLNKAYYLEEKDMVDEEQSEKSSDLEDDKEEFIDEDEDVLNASNNILSLSSSIDPGLNMKKLGGLYISFDAERQKSRSHGVVPLKEKKKDELLQKSIITPDFEKKECIPPLRESVHQLKKQRREERAKTTGDGWFGMKAPEMTEELKNDLKALKMRAAIDPKRFYKKNDREGLPKYFQVGTVVDSPVDFYHARIPKKERKKNIVEELLADSEFRRYNKRKYQDIMAEKTALAAGKKNRKKKKFHK